MWHIDGPHKHDGKRLSNLLEVALKGGTNSLPYRRLSLTPGHSNLLEEALLLEHTLSGLVVISMIKDESDLAAYFRTLSAAMACEVPAQMAVDEKASLMRRGLGAEQVLMDALPILRNTGALVGALAWTHAVGNVPRGSLLCHVQGLPSTAVLSTIKRLAREECSVLGANPN